MFYHLFYSLSNVWSGFNVFKYITFRAGGAATTALLLSIFLGPWVIRKLQDLNIGQYIRKGECPDLFTLHQKKQGTPTMGGVLILLVLLISTLLWADFTNRYIMLVLLITLCMGGVGFIDDYLKIHKKNAKGLKIGAKLLGQLIIAGFIGFYLYYNPVSSKFATKLGVPLFKNFFIDLGYFYIPFVMLVIVGASNAVNFTDGLDGLAIGCAMMVSITFIIVTYLCGHIGFSKYLNIINVVGSGELAVFCSALVGASLGFLWFNCYPAEIFMGDTGSLAIGGALGFVSVIVKQEILLVIAGGIFVMEAISVIIQIVSFRITGKRVFMLAPLHHHFEKKGWDEPKVTIRFWIVSIIFALISLATLKLR
ncbi:MAG: phospho-N-acetylmuramoyl-pentapeptide-transferase [bacterium]|nr:phospho-N-acetylmuramoyl-pentapeptide-transferase [bacterium]